MTISIWLIELNRNMTAIPVRIMVPGVSFLNLEIRTMKPTGISENRYELTMTLLSSGTKGMMEMFMMIASVAPRNAPEDIPMV